jgi:AcrR family transcriptional regulator
MSSRRPRFPRHQARVPIWARPERGHRQPRFTREQIAATALAIADAEGFEAVSMRRIAAELRSGTMTLYHYVRTKDDLRDLLDDAIMGEALVPAGELPEDWRGALTAIARSTRQTLLRHPWSIHSLQGAWFGPNALRHIDQSLAAVAGTGLDQAGQLELLALVDDYVTGYVLRLVEIRTRPPMADPEETWSEIARTLDDDARFERGLDALLTGAAIRFGLEDR